MIKSLYLKNFRLYEEALFTFSPGMNVIHGPNARGKTTILEALYLLIGGRSFRTHQMKEMIRHGADYFFVEVRFEKLGIEQSLKFAYDGKKRRITYNKTACPSPANLYGILSGIAMTPDDVGLVKGAPLERRQFLDVQLAQVDPLYVHHSYRYARALKQRNLLLKKRTEKTIDSWEKEMAKAAGYMVQQRRRVTKLFEEEGARVQREFLESLELVYKSSSPETQEEAYYADMWKRHRAREFDAGMTLAGPHRDDLLISIGGKEARVFASEGQQRSVVASLKIAGWELLNKRSDASPVMLIDDVGISLDINRREHLFDHLASLNQVFLTSTESISLNSPVDSICLL